MNILINAFGLAAKLLWKHLKFILILLVIFIIEIAYLINQAEQNEFMRFGRAELEIESCQMRTDDSSCYIDVTIYNKSSETGNIPSASLYTDGNTTCFLDPVYYEQYNNSFDIGIMVIPPGQSVSYSYKVNDFWSYREELEDAGELTFRLGYSYDENAPEYQLSFS